MSLDDDFQTLLVLSGMGLAPYSAGGIVQTLKPIGEAANLQRDVNGTLEDVSYAPFRKYETTITCTDMNAPALEGIWPGDDITIDCVNELAYISRTSAPSRAVVEGSSREVGDYTFYRPRLYCKVMDFQTSDDEWPADVQWQLTAQEI